jgi:hypothetical protein
VRHRQSLLYVQYCRLNGIASCGPRVINYRTVMVAVRVADQSPATDFLQSSNRRLHIHRLYNLVAARWDPKDSSYLLFDRVRLM